MDKKVKLHGKHTYGLCGAAAAAEYEERQQGSPPGLAVLLIRTQLNGFCQQGGELHHCPSGQ